MNRISFDDETESYVHKRPKFERKIKIAGNEDF